MDVKKRKLETDDIVASVTNACIDGALDPKKQKMEMNGVSHHTKGYLQPGDRAPEFKGKAAVLKNGDVSEVEIKLSNYLGKYVVFFFYPQDFTFVCPTEIIAFSERVEEFKKINCEVIGCSTDSYNCHRAWMKTPRNAGGLGDIHIPLLADPSHVISKAYNVLKEDEGVPFRGLFIIDPNGVLRQMTINDLPVGRDVDETLRLVQGFQFTDKHGEVCPANWKPGKKTMKPDHAGVAQYLSDK